MFKEEMQSKTQTIGPWRGGGGGGGGFCMFATRKKASASK